MGVVHTRDSSLSSKMMYSFVGTSRKDKAKWCMVVCEV